MNVLAALVVALTPWTLPHARAVLAASNYMVTDESQPDQPQYLLGFDANEARSLRKAGKRFVFDGTAYDGYTDTDVAVHFVLTRANELTQFRGPPADTTQPAFPIHAAFYYAWYPEAWFRGATVVTPFHPTLSYYSADDASVVRTQTDAMRYAHLDAAVYSWWRQRGYPDTDDRFWRYLSVARTTPFRWALYYEREGYSNPTVDEIHADLEYFRETFARAPAYLRADGRFVVFVYGGWNDNCNTVERWRAANAGIDAYLVMMVFTGFRDCAVQPDAWHHYEPATPAYSLVPDSFMVAPGFPSRVPRDLERWKRNVAAMVASGAKWQLVETFNEWLEGTAVEDAQEWQTPSGYGAYLDALRAAVP